MTYYNPLIVLKDYLTANNYTISGFNSFQSGKNSQVCWVNENAQNITHFRCHKLSDTYFEIVGINTSKEVVIRVGYDFLTALEDITETLL